MTSRRRKALVFVAYLLPAVYFLATAAFALLHYRDYASETPQFLRYVFFPAVIGLVLLVALIVAPARIGIRLSINVMAILVGLFAYEALMTARVLNILLGNFGAGEASALHNSGSFDGLPPGYTAKRLNRRLASSELPAAILSGLPNSQVLLCWDGDKPVSYRADRYGFNNPDNVYEHPVQVAVIGDSFVEGICQPPGRDITGQLRNNFPESVSLATRGSGPLFELAVLGRFGKALKPRHIVVAFFEGNDWENLEGELEDQWLPAALSPGADFGPAKLPDDVLAKATVAIAGVREKNAAPVEVVLRTRIVRNFFALSQTAVQLGLAYPKVAPDLPEYAEVLRRAKELASSWGGDLTLLYVPQNARYIGALPHGFVHDRLRNKVLAAAAEAGVDVIDLVELLGKESNPEDYYGRDAHFSERGAAFAAAAIAKKIGQLTAGHVEPAASLQ
jgi:hypothetical protein